MAYTCSVLLVAQQLYTQCCLFAVRFALFAVCHTSSQSQMKVKVTGIICINQLCHLAV